jgi:hypothetical protein
MKLLPSLKLVYLVLIISYSASSHSAIVTYNYTGFLQSTGSTNPFNATIPFTGESNVSGSLGYDNSVVDDNPDSEWIGLYLFPGPRNIQTTRITIARTEIIISGNPAAIFH